MDKTAVKLLVSKLIERGFSPQIRELAGNYTITVETSSGVTTNNVQTVENNLAVATKIHMVSFS